MDNCIRDLILSPAFCHLGVPKTWILILGSSYWGFRSTPLLPAVQMLALVNMFGEQFFSHKSVEGVKDAILPNLL